MPKQGEPFLTNWFDVENNYVPGWIVIDLEQQMFYDGTNWKLLEEDHL